MADDHLLDTTAQAFFTGLGVRAVSRSPRQGSAVRRSVETFLDAEGRELGRVERAFGPSGVAIWTNYYLRAVTPESQPERAYVWL